MDPTPDATPSDATVPDIVASGPAAPVPPSVPVPPGPPAEPEAEAHAAPPWSMVPPPGAPVYETPAPLPGSEPTTPPVPPGPPAWMPPAPIPDPVAPPPAPAPPVLGDDTAGIPPAPPAPPERPGFVLPRWVVALVLILVVGAAGYAIGLATAPDDSASNRAASQSPATPNQPAAPTPSTTNPPNTPANQALAGLVVGQADLPASYSVRLIDGGNQVQGETTLDLCNGTFPSESMRTNRLQVVAVTDQQATLSTEAVLYTNPAATAQAFKELASVAASCPSTPVRSPVGNGTATTTFDPPPDSTWPQVAGVDRLAYSFTSTDTQGESSPSVAVYLRRGRALMGIYFVDPTNVPTVAGQSTIEGIVGVFAHRMAELPDAIVNG